MVEKAEKVCRFCGERKVPVGYATCGDSHCQERSFLEGKEKGKRGRGRKRPAALEAEIVPVEGNLVVAVDMNDACDKIALKFEALTGLRTYSDHTGTPGRARLLVSTPKGSYYLGQAWLGWANDRREVAFDTLRGCLEVGVVQDVLEQARVRAVPSLCLVKVKA
jgi:hypothetical protein